MANVQSTLAFLLVAEHTDPSAVRKGEGLFLLAAKARACWKSTFVEIRVLKCR